jgi:phosphocarrier protein FPr
MLLIEFLDGSQRDKVRLCGAPFVEGAVAAGVLAAMGSELDEVAAEAVKALRHKTAHLDASARNADETQTAGAVANDDSFLAARVAVKNPHGLHARPAAQFIREAARYDCEILVRNLTNGRGPASAKSMSSLASIEILQVMRSNSPHADRRPNRPWRLFKRNQAGLGRRLDR